MRALVSSPNTRRRLIAFYLSYAIGLFAPVVLGVVLYFRSVDLTERAINTQVSAALDRAAADLESIYEDVEFVVSQASLNERVQELASISYESDSEKYSRLLDLVFRPAMLDSSAFSRLVLDFYLILPKPGLVLGSAGSLPIESFYAHEFTVSGFDTDTFLAEYVEPEFQFELRHVDAARGLTSNYEETLILLHSLDPKNNPANRFVFVLDRRAIEGTLRRAAVEDGSAVFALGRNQEVIAQLIRKGPGFEVGVPAVPSMAAMEDWRMPGDAVRYSAASPAGNIRVLSWLSPQVLVSEATYVRTTTLVIVLSVILVDLLLILLLSRANAHPLSRILASLESELRSPENVESKTGSRVGLGLRNVHRQLERVLEQKHGLQAELARQKPLLAELVLRSLVRGVPAQERELENLLTRSGVGPASGFRCCIVLSVEVAVEGATGRLLSEFALRKLALEEICRRTIRGDLSFLYESHDTVVLIHAATTGGTRYLRRLIRDTHSAVDTLRREIGTRIMVGVGNAYQALSKLRVSYEEAMVAVGQYAPLAENGFAAYSDVVGSQQTYHYPIELELKLLNATRRGSSEAVRQVMGEVGRMNFEERRLSPASVRVLTGELQGTVAKISASIEAATGLAHEEAESFVSGSRSTEDWRGTLAEATSVLCSLALFFESRRRGARSGISREAVEAFVHENFSNVNLGLTMMADHFGVTEKYFSRYFKERFTVSFQLYVESLRLEHARSLMASTDFGLHDISLACGYSSAMTFSRAFKRRFGLRPSEYRASLL